MYMIYKLPSVRSMAQPSERATAHLAHSVRTPMIEHLYNQVLYYYTLYTHLILKDKNEINYNIFFRYLRYFCICRRQWWNYDHIIMRPVDTIFLEASLLYLYNPTF